MINLETYPNPFDDYLRIELELLRDCECVITIQNLLGKEVRSIFSGIKEKGKYTFSWDSDNVSSGIYFIKVKTEGNLITKKVIKE